MLRFVIMLVVVGQSTAFWNVDMSSWFGALEDKTGSLKEEISSGISNLHDMWTGSASLTDETMVLVNETANTINTMENGYNVTRKTTTLVFMRPMTVNDDNDSDSDSDEDDQNTDDQEVRDEIEQFLEGLDLPNTDEDDQTELDEIAAEVEEQMEDQLEDAVEMLPQTVTLIRTEMNYEGHDISGKAQSVHVITDYGADLNELPNLPEILVEP